MDTYGDLFTIAIVALAIAQWVNVGICMPTRPKGVDEVYWLAYLRQESRWKSMIVFALLLTTIAFVAIITRIPMHYHPENVCARDLDQIHC